MYSLGINIFTHWKCNNQHAVFLADLTLKLGCPSNPVGISCSWPENRMLEKSFQQQSPSDCIRINSRLFVRILLVRFGYCFFSNFTFFRSGNGLDSNLS